MDKAEILVQACLQEYAQLRAELNARIGLQNSMMQRALYLAGITATLALTVLLFLLERQASVGTVVTSLTLSLSADKWEVLATCLLVLTSAFSLLMLLFICAWVYHLQLIFRIDIYLAWMGTQTLAPQLDPDQRPLVFRYSRLIGDPVWKKPLGDPVVFYFQAGVMYGLSAVGTLILVGIAVIQAAAYEPRSWVLLVSLILAVVVALTLRWLYGVHRRVIGDYNRIRKELEADAGAPDTAIADLPPAPDVKPSACMNDEESPGSSPG